MAVKKAALAAVLALFLVLPSLAQTGYEPAIAQYVRGNYSAAVDILKEYVENTPEPDAYYLLGYALYNLGKHEEANEYFKATFLIEPEFSPQPLIKRLEKAKAAEGIFKKKPAKKPVAKKQPPAKEPIPVKEPVAPVAPAKQVPFYKGLIAEYGLMLFAAIGALYILSSLCLFLAARKLGLSGSWMAFIPVLQVLPYVKAIVALLKKSSMLKRIMGLLLIVPGVNLLILFLLAFSKKEEAISIPEPTEYPEPELPEPPGFEPQEFEQKESVTPPEEEEFMVPEEKETVTPVEEGSMTPPWAEWDGEPSKETETEEKGESVTPDDFLRFESERAFDDTLRGTVVKKKSRVGLLLIALAVVLVLASALVFFLRGMPFSVKAAPKVAPVKGISWVDPSGDIINDVSGRPRADIVGVKAEGRDGLLSISAKMTKDVAEFFSYAGPGGERQGASIVEYYLDVDNNADTGGTGLFRGEANRPVKGYEFKIAVFAGFFVRDGVSVGEIRGDVEIDPAKNPIIGNVVSYKIWTAQNGELAAVSSSVWSYEALTKSEGDSVEVSVPYELLGVKPGGVVRLSFNELGQKPGEGFSEDKLFNLEGGALPEKPTVKKTWEDFLSASEKGDAAAVKTMADGVNKALYEIALYRAALNGHSEVVKFLLEKGASPNIKDDAGQSPIFLAAANRRTDIMQSLIEKGADVNAKTVAGETALIRAVAWGDAEMVKLLLKAGAKTNVKSASGHSPLKLAQDAKRADLVKLLKAAKKG